MIDKKEAIADLLWRSSKQDLAEQVIALEQQLSEARNRCEELEQTQTGLAAAIGFRDSDIDMLRQQLATAKAEGMREALKEAAAHECVKCGCGVPLSIEPSTGRYTHALGGNFCGADWIHTRIAQLDSKGKTYAATPLRVDEIAAILREHLHGYPGTAIFTEDAIRQTAEKIASLGRRGGEA